LLAQIYWIAAAQAYPGTRPAYSILITIWH